MGCEGRSLAGDLLHAGARDPPGLHRRARDRRPRRHAPRDARPRRRRGEDESTASRRARHRPLRPGRRLREPDGDARQHRPRVRAERRALRLPPLGTAGVRRPQGRPPETGIVHQVNLEYLGRVVEARNGQAFPDTLLGTDSHTTMINGLGVLGWGVGGIEAEAAMLGESVSMLVPQVVGFRLRLHARGRDRDRPRPDRDADPPSDRRCREVRRVLRRGRLEPPARRPGDDREHVAGVRRDLRLLPRRPGHARVPPADGPPGGANRARRGLLQGESPLARPRPRADLHAGRGARSRRRRAQSRRPAAAAGPRAAHRCKRSFLAALETFGVDYGTSTTQQSPSRSPRATRPPTARRATTSPPEPIAVPATVLAERAKPYRSSWTGSGSTSSTAPS